MESHKEVAMFGFLFGAALVFFVMNRHRFGGCSFRHDGSFRRGRGGRRGFGFGRAMGEMFKRRLDIDEEQEEIVDPAMDELRGVMSELKEAFAASRSDVAKAFRSESVDDAALGATFDHLDAEIARLRRKAVSALKQVHAVLDAEQREEVARWMNRHHRHA